MADKIFKGATRPPIALGVPLVPLVLVGGGLLIVALLTFLLVNGTVGLIVLILAVAVFFYMKAETKEDDQRLHQLGLKMRMRWREWLPKSKTKKYWNATSSSPMDYRRNNKAELGSARFAASETRDSDRIPMRRNVTPEVQITKDGDYLATWKLEGLSFEALSPADEEAELNSLNAVIQSLSDGKFVFWVHRIRRTQEDTLMLPPNRFRFAQQLVSKYYDKLGVMALTELYLTLIYRPPVSDAVARLRANEQDFADKRAVELQVLEGTAKLIESSLKAYKPTRLGEYEYEGRLFNRQRELFNYLINLRWARVPAKDLPLDTYYSDTRKLFGNEIVEARSAHGSLFGAFLDIKEYAEWTDSGKLNPLLKLQGNFVETQSFSPLNKMDAASSLKRQIGQLSSSDDDSPTQRREMSHALDELASGRFALGEYHYSLLVISDSAESALKQRSNAADVLQNCDFKAVAVDIVPDGAFWAQLPGNWRNRTRIAQLSSRNFVGLASMHAYNSGKRDDNPWGEAVTIMRTASGQPYYFNFHRTPYGTNSFGMKVLGSTQIIGQSGEGKTVLASFLAANLLKFGASWVWLDMNHSAEIFIRAVGGRYSTLEPGVKTGFAPFKREPTQKEIQHWIELVCMCAKPLNRELTTNEVLVIEAAVKSVATFDQHERNFGAVLQNLGKVDDDNEIQSRIRRWADSENGSNAWALDGDEDTVNIGDGIPQGFDYTELLGQGNVCPIVLFNLLYRIEEVIDGRRFAVFMEEYWRALENPCFMEFAKTKLKVIRKQNGFVVFLTQSPSDALASPISAPLIEQTATFIFLPNPSADAKEYIEGFKLTPAEFAIIKSLPQGRNIMMIKQGTNVAVVQLDLSGMRQELMVLGGSDDTVQRLTSLRERLGDNPDDWLEPFWRGES